MIKKIVIGIFKFIIPLIVVAAGTYIAVVLIRTKPEASKKEQKQAIPMVETITAHITDEKISVPGWGTVIPAKQVIIQPEVTGRVIEQNKSMIPGGIVKEGDQLLQIDPQDYQFAVEQQDAAVENAQFNVKMEEGRRTIADREWKLLGEEVKSTDLGKELALRIPQMANVKAALNAAQSRLNQAKLQLARTKIKAPFNSIVQTESIEIGQYVNPQTRIATLMGTDQFWLQVSIPVNYLQYIQLPQKIGEKGSPVTVIQDYELNTQVKRQGYVLRLLGDLDPDGHLARILVAIDDPLLLKIPASERSLPLMVGDYVHAKIEGSVLAQVCVIPRTALREGDKIWILNTKNELEVRPVKIVWREEENVLIHNTIKDGEQIITSRLVNPIPGMKLQLYKDENFIPKDRPVENQISTKPEASS